MYGKRVKIFIAISLGLMIVCVLRLVQMQLLADSSLQDDIAQLKRQRGLSRQLKTIRGRILDRRDNVLAADVPRFQICINYRLASFLDDRVIAAKEPPTAADAADAALVEFNREIDAKRQDLEQIIEKCTRFGPSAEQVRGRIQSMNDRVWNLRTFLAWYRSGPDPNLIARYGRVVSVPVSRAIADFEQRCPDPTMRRQRIADVDDIPEMNEDLALLELETEDDIFAAQVEFMDIEDVRILPKAHRHYPYESVAAQTIGWVGPATQPRDIELFEDDPLASYLEGDLCGREDGVEYVCERLLRGRRGERLIDLDGRLVREKQADFGEDVVLTLDIHLQQRIEALLTDPDVNPAYCDANMAAVVLDIRSGDILAMVSLPTYDLNRVRYDYNDLVHDPNRPLINRVINELYPPGSVVKPLILVAGLESGVITADEVISCPAAPAPAGWPDCVIWRTHQAAHDWSWENHARNAIKGSCNIYFSHLANRLEPRRLQRWLFAFGYGHEIPLACPLRNDDGSSVRALRQVAGRIDSATVSSLGEVKSLQDVPPLREEERRLFGIGHGSMRATPLQVADAFATLARGGIRKDLHLFLRPAPAGTEREDLGISPTTLQVVRDGMSAVVNEPGGTAYKEFAPSRLDRQDVKVYGKTGSTERPYHAWFAGYAEDREGAKIAVAVVVEGGEWGSSDAAPLARDILQLCIEAGYIGTPALGGIFSE